MHLTNKWTPQDEAALTKLLDRKKAFEAEARAPLNKLVADMNLSFSGPRSSSAPTPPYPSQVVDLLVARADELRDALAPFDSGVRCGGGQG